MFPVQWKPPPSSYSSSAAQLLVSISILVSPLWQLWEAAPACWCHVNQIRCHNRKSVHIHVRSTVTHALDLLPLQAKCRPSGHWYADMNLLWVKGNWFLKQPHFLEQVRLLHFVISYSKSKNPVMIQRKFWNQDKELTNSFLVWNQKLFTVVFPVVCCHKRRWKLAFGFVLKLLCK